MNIEDRLHSSKNLAKLGHHPEAIMELIEERSLLAEKIIVAIK